MSGPPVFVYTLPMPPKAAPRPRLGNGRAFNTTQYTRWKQDAAVLLSAAKRAHQLSTIETACALAVEFVLPRPKKRPPKNSLHLMYWHPTNDYPYPHRPDLDNLAKSIKDALTQAHVWADDCLVVETSQTKEAGCEPAIHITISLVHPEHD